jgi:hypothetical protein
MSRPGLDSQYEIHGDPNDTRDALEGPPARRLWVSRAIAFILVAASAYCVFRGFSRYSPTTENIATLTAFLGGEKKPPTKDELGGLDPKAVVNAWTELTTRRLGAERIHLWSTYALMALCPVGLLAALYVWWRGQFIRSQPVVTIDRFQVYPTAVALVLIAAVMGFNVYTQGALGRMPSGASFKTFVQEKQDARKPERFAVLRERFQQAVATLKDPKQKPVARAEAAKGVLRIVSRADFGKLCPEAEKGPMIAALHELINANYANEMVCPPLIKSLGALGAAAEMAKASAEREKNRSAWVDVKTLSAIRYLHAAVTSGNEAAVRQLIRRGIDVNSLVPGRGHTALHQAVFQRNGAIAKVLLDAKARVDVAGTHGKSPAVKEFPLHRAVGEPQLVKLLLDRGAAADVVDAGGMTPLHRAAAAGDVESARLLIQYSAAVNRLDKGGRTPRDIAEKLAATDKKTALRDLLDRNGGQLSTQLAAKPTAPATPKAIGKTAGRPNASSTARAAGPTTQPTSPATPKPVVTAPAKPTPVASTPRD